MSMGANQSMPLVNGQVVMLQDTASQGYVGRQWFGLGMTVQLMEEANADHYTVVVVDEAANQVAFEYNGLIYSAGGGLWIQNPPINDQNKFTITSAGENQIRIQDIYGNYRSAGPENAQMTLTTEEKYAAVFIIHPASQ
jgi:hypothetical protein